MASISGLLIYAQFAINTLCNSSCKQTSRYLPFLTHPIIKCWKCDMRASFQCQLIAEPCRQLIAHSSLSLTASITIRSLNGSVGQCTARASNRSSTLKCWLQIGTVYPGNASKMIIDRNFDFSQIGLSILRYVTNVTKKKKKSEKSCRVFKLVIRYLI